MEKFYVVTLEVHIGEYQKLVPHLVTAKNPQEAGRAAIIDESHDDPKDLKWVVGGAYDLGGEFYYKVFRSTEVSEEDVETLTSYMW